jgi:hypothetical protein
MEDRDEGRWERMDDRGTRGRRGLTSGGPAAHQSRSGSSALYVSTYASVRACTCGASRIGWRKQMSGRVRNTPA